MEEFNVNEILLENYKKQIKNLREIYELMNDELEILNTMIEIVIPEEQYQEIRSKAMSLIEERKEDE